MTQIGIVQIGTAQIGIAQIGKAQVCIAQDDVIFDSPPSGQTTFDRYRVIFVAINFGGELHVVTMAVKDFKLNHGVASCVSEELGCLCGSCSRVGCPMPIQSL